MLKIPRMDPFFQARDETEQDFSAFLEHFQKADEVSLVLKIPRMESFFQTRDETQNIKHK